MEEIRIRQLINRFLDGATTNAEEQTLYDYFAGEDIAPELMQYRDMFRWYSAGMPERNAKQRRMPLRRILALAASVLLLVGIGFGIHRYQKQQEEYALYEGSYIIRDGVKITDISKILPELKATEQSVSEMMKQQNNNTEIPTI